MKINIFKNSNKNLLKILLVYLLSNLYFSVFAGPQKILLKVVMTEIPAHQYLEKKLDLHVLIPLK